MQGLLLGLKWLRDDEGKREKGHMRFEEEVWEEKQKPNCLSGRKTVAED